MKLRFKRSQEELCRNLFTVPTHSKTGYIYFPLHRMEAWARAAAAVQK